MVNRSLIVPKVINNPGFLGTKKREKRTRKFAVNIISLSSRIRSVFVKVKLAKLLTLGTLEHFRHLMIVRIGCALSILIFLSGCSGLPFITKTGKIAGQGGDLTIASTVKETSNRGLILGIGDEVKITVWKHDDLSRVLRIDPAGKLFYPLVGEIDSMGLSTTDLRKIITDGLSGYIINPQVNVQIHVFRGKKVYVLGEVRQPGVLTIEDSMHIMDGLLLAGGFTPDADEKKVILIRTYPKEIELYSININDVLEKGDTSQIAMLQNGDIVYVPPSFIADVDRFFKHLDNIFYPIVHLERSIILGDEVWNLLKGKNEGKRTIVIGD